MSGQFKAMGPNAPICILSNSFEKILPVTGLLTTGILEQKTPLRASPDIGAVNVLKDDFDLIARKMGMVRPYGATCSSIGQYVFKANLPVVGERFVMTFGNFEAFAVKNTTITIGYSGVPSPTPGPQIAVEPSIPPQPDPSSGPVAAPFFSLRSGAYDSPQKISISSPTPDASIYYTTDGSMPTTSSTFYSGAIDISSTSTIKAFAVKAGLIDSAVATSNYAIIGGKPVSKVGIGFEDGSDFDYTDVSVCLNGSFFVNSSEVVAAKDQQSVTINWGNLAKIAHLMTVKVTDIAGIEIFNQSYQGRSKAPVMPDIALSMPFGSKLTIDLDHGAIQQNDIGGQPHRVQLRQDSCRGTQVLSLPTKL